MRESKSTGTYTVAVIIFIAIKYISGLVGDNFSYYPAAPYVTKACYIIAFLLAGISLIISIVEVAAGSKSFLAMLAKYIFMTIVILLLFYATVGVFTVFLLVCLIIGAIVMFA